MTGQVKLEDLFCKNKKYIELKQDKASKPLPVPYATFKEIINFTIQNVSGRFRDAYYIPGLSFWGVFFVRTVVEWG